MTESGQSTYNENQATRPTEGQIAGHTSGRRLRAAGIMAAVAGTMVALLPAAASVVDSQSAAAVVVTQTAPPWNNALATGGTGPWHDEWDYTDCGATDTCAEYGVDVGLPQGTPIDAPEAGKVTYTATGSQICPDWQPGFLTLTLPSGAVIRFGHVVSGLSTTPTPVVAGQQIGNVGPSACWWTPHVEFMYSPFGGLSLCDFVGCPLRSLSDPQSPLTLLGTLMTGGSPPTPPVLSVEARTPSSVTLMWAEPSPGVASSFTVLRDGVILGSTTSVTFTDAQVGETSHRYQVVANGNGQIASSATVTTSATTTSSFRVDVNGDGKADLVYVYPGSTAYLDTFLSNGDGTYRKVTQSLGGFDAAGGTWF
jgi:hypothetical protein